LITQVGEQMEANALRVIVDETVVKTLVVAVVEPLLLEFPLQVPIGLGDENRVRMFPTCR